MVQYCLALFLVKILAAAVLKSTISCSGFLSTSPESSTPPHDLTVIIGEGTPILTTSEIRHRRLH